MTIPVKLKRSGTTTATPSSLEYGEIAINYADGVVFYRDSSDVIQSFTLQAYALSSHTHAASDITSGTLDAARLPLATTGAVGGVIVGTGLGVSSGTVSVTYGTTSGTACQGNDSRLSDARTPTAHKTSHATGGSDALTPSDIGAAPTASPAFTGAATFDNTGNVVPLTITNTGTANSFVVNDASGDTSPFVIDASGNVGIGTSSPTCNIDLRVANTGALGPQLNLWNAGTFNNTNSCRIGFSTDSGGSTTTPNAAIDAVQVVGAGGGTELRFLTWNGSALETRVTVGHTGQLLVTAGSASAPGVAVSGDTNTGIAQIGGADTLSLVTGGSERVRVDASGNVLVGTQGGGLGVSSPPYLQLGNQFSSTAGDAAKSKLRFFEDSSGNICGFGVSNALFETHAPSGAALATYIGNTERFRIDASGNVGIGAAPNARLHVNTGTDKNFYVRSGIRLSGSALQSIQDNNATDSPLELYTQAQVQIEGNPITFYNNGERLRIASDGVFTFAGQLLVTAGSASAPGVAFGPSDTNTGMFSPGADQLAFSTNQTERMRIDASGNVLIGTQSGGPVSTPNYLQMGNQFASTAGDAAKTKLRFFEDSGGDIFGFGVSNSLFETHAPANCALATYVGNTERFRISSAGTITAAQVYSDTVGATNRDLFIDDTGKLGYVSSIRASKTGIAAIDDVSWLRDLTPVSFHYRRKDDDGNYTDDTDGTLDYGLIAEDVEPVAPEMCFYDVVDGSPQLRGVHYSKLITPMLRYIQQLEARIAALEEKINA